MDHTPADIARWTLIQLGLGTDGGALWPVFTDEPDSPDSCITVYTTQGTIFGDDHTSGEVLGTFGVQFRVRSATPRLGWRKADAIRTAISQSVLNLNVTVTDPTAVYNVHCFGGIGQVLSLGKDRSNTRRWLYTLNASINLG